MEDRWCFIKNLIAKIQNICNLSGREECNIGHIVVSIDFNVVLFNKKATTFEFRQMKNRNLLLKNKLIINY